jgi:arylsulfatase A-like enzyme
MSRHLFAIIMTLILAAGFVRPATAQAATAADRPPNIVLILTDDLGYGDLGCYGATLNPTPNIDRLAAQGIRFTQAYAPSSTCTPTRYAIMTGEYGWRQPQRRTAILDGDAPLCILPDQFTLPQLLRKAGYTTGLVGKWHLGLGDGVTPIDFNGRIAPGPRECGFDSAFFIPATVDRVPCVYIQNRRVANLDPADPIRVSYINALEGAPAGRDHPELLNYKGDEQHSDVAINGISRIGYMTGGKAARWVDEDISDVLADRAAKFIDANKNGPFFLLLGTTDPHVPHGPHARFVGKSGTGIRGDTIVQLDDLVGQVLDTLDRQGLADNTLVLLTSDNGPVVFDGYFDGSVENLNGHQPADGLRGWKYLVFEGGTRVPLIARWPGRIQPGKSGQMVSLVDLMASLGALVDEKLPEGAGKDSLNCLEALLKADASSPRRAIIQHGVSNALAIRDGDWKYIPSNATEDVSGIGRGANPLDTRFVESIFPQPLLFNLADDPAETTNLIDKNPGKAEQLAALMARIRERGDRAVQGERSVGDE